MSAAAPWNECFKSKPLTSYLTKIPQSYLYIKTGWRWHNKADFEISSHCHPLAYSGWVWTLPCYGAASCLAPSLLTLCSVPLSPSQCIISSKHYSPFTYNKDFWDLSQYCLSIFDWSFYFWFSLQVSLPLLHTELLLFSTSPYICDMCTTLNFLRSVLMTFFW